MQDTCRINVISSSSFNAKHFYISAFFLVLIKQQCNQPQLLLSILFCVISDQCGLHCRLYSQLWMKPHFRHLFICDPWSMFIFRPFFPSSIKSWIIVISSLLPLQSDFLWFLIIFRAQQKWFLETLNVFYFSSLLGIKTSCVDLKLPIALRLITNLNLLACQTLLWSPYLASHQMSRIFVNCVNFYTSSESLNLSSWLASCPSHSETCFSSNFKSNTQQRSKKIFLN